MWGGGRGFVGGVRGLVGEGVRGGGVERGDDYYDGMREGVWFSVLVCWDDGDWA